MPADAVQPFSFTLDKIWIRNDLLCDANERKKASENLTKKSENSENPIDDLCMGFHMVLFLNGFRRVNRENPSAKLEKI